MLISTDGLGGSGRVRKNVRTGKRAGRDHSHVCIWFGEEDQDLLQRSARAGECRGARLAHARVQLLGEEAHHSGMTRRSGGIWYP